MTSPSTRQLIISGTLMSLTVALLVAWLTVLRPAGSESDTITVDQLLQSDDSATPEPGDLGPGDAVPPVTLKGLDGPDLSTTALPDTTTVINFWASNCAPCIAEMPLLETAHQDLGESVNFVGINVLEGPEQARDMIGRTGVSFAQVLDPAGTVLAAFGGKQLPHTVVIAPDGRIAAVIDGAIADRAELDAAIARSTSGAQDPSR